MCGSVFIKGDGTPWRPLVHIQDVAQAFTAVVQAPRDVVHNQIFNVGNENENYRVREIADVVQQTVPGCQIEYAKNPNVGPNAGWAPHMSKEDSMNIIKMFVEGEEVWAIEYKENHKVIGSIGLHKDQLRSTEDVKMLGYVLSEEYWGKNYAFEAVGAVIDYSFNELSLGRLFATIDKNNQRSRKLIERLGFTLDAIIPQGDFGGRIADIAYYSKVK
jgi:putative acetyltransferase